MKIEAKINLKEFKPTGKFYVHAKFPNDSEDHPYGQWSLLIEPKEFGKISFPAIISFLAGEPNERVEDGICLELFRGVKFIGTALCNKIL